MALLVQPLLPAWQTAWAMLSQWLIMALLQASIAANHFRLSGHRLPRSSLWASCFFEACRATLLASGSILAWPQASCVRSGRMAGIADARPVVQPRVAGTIGAGQHAGAPHHGTRLARFGIGRIALQMRRNSSASDCMTLLASGKNAAQQAFLYPVSGATTIVF